MIARETSTYAGTHELIRPLARTGYPPSGRGFVRDLGLFACAESRPRSSTGLLQKVSIRAVKADSRRFMADYTVAK
jgi:hypothetical protein